ncbi:MAG: hypothetical protein Q8P46_01825 [Hyphomicrobiales bacterium]|nr:hypothetical protein [Hyphomicrobiales bacterium]
MNLPTHATVDSLELDPRPLVICDVDEVVLQFVAAFERHIVRHGFRLDPRSFALFGNIKRGGDDSVADDAEVGNLLRSFFAAETSRMDLVPGALDALRALSERAQIVLLTNIHATHFKARLENLRAHGILYPVVANEGPKGPAVASICTLLAAPVFFIDDSPSNIRSVVREAPHAHVIHFMSDSRYLQLAEPIEGVRLRTGQWDEAQSFIETVIAREFERRT